MSTQPQQHTNTGDDRFSDRALSSWPRLGVRTIAAFLIIVGLLAIIFPMISTLVYELFIGWLFIFGGIGMLFRAFGYSADWRSIFGLFFAALSIAVGAIMVLFPGIGIFALTLAVAALLIGDGIISAVYAFRVRHNRSWIFLLLSSLLGIALGVFLITQLPESALVTLGLLLGVVLFVNGISLLAWNLGGRKPSPPLSS